MRPILIGALASVSIKIALSFHPALPPQSSFINVLHADTFDEESPETSEVFYICIKMTIFVRLPHMKLYNYKHRWMK